MVTDFAIGSNVNPIKNQRELPADWRLRKIDIVMDKVNLS
jgi:hypothetical protein